MSASIRLNNASVRSLRVVHVPDDTLLDTVRRHHGEDIVRRLIAEHPPIEQPLVRLHADTGRPALWLSPLYAAKVVGLDDADSRRAASRAPSPDPGPGGAGSVAVGRRRRRHLGRDQHLPPGADRSRAATSHHASLHDHGRPTDPGRRMSDRHMAEFHFLRADSDDDRFTEGSAGTRLRRPRRPGRGLPVG